MRPRPAQFHSLLHSADLLEKRLTTMLTPLGVRPRQARILDALQRMGSTSQVQLAREFGVSAGSMSSMTDRLVAKGLVLRQNNPDDRRGDILSLTSSGTRMLDDVLHVWRDVDAIIKTALGLEKAADLTRLTKELRVALGGNVPGEVQPTNTSTTSVS